MPHRVLDRATDIVATAGIVSPLWLPVLSDLSHIAGLFMPILGCFWMLVQIWKKFTETKDKP